MSAFTTAHDADHLELTRTEGCESHKDPFLTVIRCSKVCQFTFPYARWQSV